MNTTPKVALVTGASSGFGQSTAVLLTAQGFLVFGTSRAPARDTTGSFELLPLDVCSETSVQTCVQTILDRTGRIDLLVNNAGFAQAGALEENSLEDAQAQFDTNVFGVLRMLKAVLPVMRLQGSGQIIIPIRCLWYNTKRKEGTHSEAEGHYGQNHACSRALAS